MAVLGMLLWAGAGHAGVITLRTQMALSVADRGITVRVTTVNAGSEAAQKVSAVLHIFGQTLQSGRIEAIAVQATHVFEFDIRIPGNKEGRFPFVGEVFFHDDRQKTYSALSAGLFVLNNRHPVSLTGTAPFVELDRTGTLSITLTNRLARPQTVSATLYLPHALRCSENKTTLNLEARGKQTLLFEIVNHSGSGGAKYPVFCVLESDSDGQHNTALVGTTVNIREPGNWFVQTRWYWLWGLGGLGLIWCGVGVRRIGKRERS